MTAVEAQDFPQIKTFFSFQGLLKETPGATTTRLDTGRLFVFGEAICPRCMQPLSWQCERGTTCAECPSSWISRVVTSSSSTRLSKSGVSFFCTRSFRISTILFAPGQLRPVSYLATSFSRAIAWFRSLATRKPLQACTERRRWEVRHTSL